MSNRRFNEQEISSILKRATELQVQQDGAGAHPHHGLTLEEIQQLALEVGVDPGLVAWAVEEMDQPAAQADGFHVWGGPLKIERTRQVRAELTDDMMDKLIHEIRERRQEMGSFEKLGGAMIWQNKADKADVEVKVAPREGGATIKTLQKRGTRTFLLFYVPLLITFLIGLPVMANRIFLSPGLEVLIMAAIMLAEFLAIRAGVGILSRKDQREIEALVQHLESMLQETTPTPTLQEPTPSAKLDLPEATDSEPEIVQRQRSKTR